VSLGHAVVQEQLSTLVAPLIPVDVDGPEESNQHEDQWEVVEPH